MNIHSNEQPHNGSEQHPVVSEDDQTQLDLNAVHEDDGIPHSYEVDDQSPMLGKDFYVYTREKQTHSSMTAAAEATKEENGREMIAITTAHDDPNVDAILGDGGIYEVGAMDQLLCNVGLAAFNVCDGMAAVVDRGGLLMTEFDNIEPPLNGREQPSTDL